MHVFKHFFIYCLWRSSYQKGGGGENCDPSLTPPPYAGLSTFSKVEGYFEKVGGERRAIRGEKI